MAVTITSLILFLIGLALGGGGIRLAMLGGSWYYVVAGLAFLIAAWLLYRRRSTALWLYAAIVLGTLAWAVWETGFDWWELGPRGGVIVLLALWLLTPWARRGLVGPDARAPLILAVLASLAVAGYSMTSDPKDIA
ncbi:membrane-bound PQQ-dependent dehydrogenase, glucose/quinate/shikimate family, partial [Mesorhizobium sp. M7A.F.Ca.CA.002.15.1.1]